MQLTGKQIVEEGLVTNYVPEAIQQQGMDVRLMKVRRFGHYAVCGIDGHKWKDSPKWTKNLQLNEIGFIPARGKTVLPKSEEIEVDELGEFDGRMVKGWILEPGYYEVIFDEGCRMPNDRVMVLISRSSAVRCGAFIECGQFDAGFETDHMGCFLHVDERIAIEEHARIAQLRFTTTDKVEGGDMYNGQWQNDKQRQEQQK